MRFSRLEMQVSVLMTSLFNVSKVQNLSIKVRNKVAVLILSALRFLNLQESRKIRFFCQIQNYVPDHLLTGYKFKKTSKKGTIRYVAIHIYHREDYSGVVACTCNPATLEAVLRNGVGSIPVEGVL